MYIVIFRATIRELDAQYSATASRMRKLAMQELGCLDFHSVCEGKEEISLSYWPDEASILAWKNHPEHQLAQQLGRERWYASYTVEIVQVARQYHWLTTLPVSPHPATRRPAIHQPD